MKLCNCSTYFTTLKYLDWLLFHDYDTLKAYKDDSYVSISTSYLLKLSLFKKNGWSTRLVYSIKFPACSLNLNPLPHGKRWTKLYSLDFILESLTRHSGVQYNNVAFYSRLVIFNLVFALGFSFIGNLFCIIAKISHF